MDNNLKKLCFRQKYTGVQFSINFCVPFWSLAYKHKLNFLDKTVLKCGLRILKKKLDFALNVL